MEGERTKLQKTVLWVLLAMAVIFAVVNIVLHLNPGVAFEETLLDITVDGEKTVYTGEKYGDDITITVYPEGTGQVVTLTIGSSVDQVYRVKYPGGTIAGEYGDTYERITITCDEKILLDGGYNPDASFSKFCDLNGTSELPFNVRVEASGNPWYDFELFYSQVMAFANGPETTTRGSWLFYGLAVFLSAIVAVDTAFPYTLFYLGHALSVKDPEPTDLYLQMQAVGSVIGAVAVFVVYMIGVTKIV